MSPARALTTMQALYFGATGVWPLVHVESFMRVTGPKAEVWLVRTVGAVVTAIGATLGRSALRDAEPSADVRLLGATSAAALAGVDLVYAGTGRIAPIYLADAVIELGLLAGWLAAGRAPARRTVATRRTARTALSAPPADTAG